LNWALSSFLVIAVVLGAGWLAYERGRPSARMVAVVGTLAAVAALGRDAFVALPEVKPITAITFVVGYALGPLPGFTVGAVGMLASNILLGQGPYTPWQMAAWGLVGIAGAILGRLSGRRLGRVTLGLGCAVSALAAKEIMDFYTWTIGASHTPAAFLAVAGAALPFDLVDTVASFFFGLAFAPELARLLARTRARMHVSWEVAGEPRTGEVVDDKRTGAALGEPAKALGMLAVLVLVGFAGFASAGGGTARAASLSPELSFLARAQNTNGGFGGAPGQSSNELDSAWAAMGLAAAGRDTATVRRGGRSVVDAIRGEASTLQGPGDLERTILALYACGVPVTSLAGADPVVELLRSREHDGSFEDLVNITAFAVFALRAAGRPANDPVVSAAGRWIAAQEHADGGFGFAGGEGPSDVDDTAAALQALLDAGVRKGALVSRAVAFLVGAQNPDGGYPQEAGGQSNAQSTSWAIQGLIAAGRKPGAIHRDGSRSPVGYLQSLLAPNGSVRYSRTSAQTPVWVTAQALTALAGAPFPIAPVRHRATSSAAGKRRLYPVGTMPAATASKPIAWVLRVAALCLLGLAGTWILVATIPAVRNQDAIALYDFTQLSRPRFAGLGNGLLHLLNPMPFIVWGAALVAVALSRRRPRVALAVALVLALAPLSAEILKPLLAYPHVQRGWSGIGSASWPSGHATAAMALALCAVLVAPRRLRPAIAALGALFAVVVGFTLLVLAWHMPSDVFGGYLLAALWVSLAIAGLRLSETRWPARSGRAAQPRSRSRSQQGTQVPGTSLQGAEALLPVLLVAGVGLAMALLVLARGHNLDAFAGDHRSLIVAASGLAALAVLICSTITAAMRN
jgi:energy-coupling factor transport system substrate-specific component